MPPQKPHSDNDLTCHLMGVSLAASWSSLPRVIKRLQLPGYGGTGVEEGLSLEIFFCLLYFAQLELGL